MIEIFNKGNDITLQTSGKNQITFDIESLEAKIDNLDVVHPGEFEKSGILLEVKEYNDILFYSFRVDGTHIVIISNDKFELKEEILTFFGDVDILVIVGSKESAKIFESIEARVVVPYGEGKSTFLNTLGQHTEEINSYKLKADLPTDVTEFVNLK